MDNAKNDAPTIKKVKITMSYDSPIFLIISDLNTEYLIHKKIIFF